MSYDVITMWDAEVKHWGRQSEKEGTLNLKVKKFTRLINRIFWKSCNIQISFGEKLKYKGGLQIQGR